MKSSRFSLPTGAGILASLVSVCSVGCVTDDVDPSTAAAGSGGSGTAGAPSAAAGAPASSGAGGTPSAGGSGGAADLRSDPAFGVAVECPPLQVPLITDFAPAAAAADAGATDAGMAPTTGGATFGDYTTTLSGGTFTYPNAAGDPYVVSSDVNTGAWHVSGNIGNYSGFGLFFNGCNRIDASAYTGISFTIRGNVAMGGTVTFSVGTSSNDISHLWLNSQPMPPNPLADPNSGRCLPAMNANDNSCSASTFTVPVTATAATIEVLWADLAGGRPSAAVNPAEITGIRWIFPNPAGAGTSTPIPYAADLYLDNLTFISP